MPIDQRVDAVVDPIRFVKIDFEVRLEIADAIAADVAAGRLAPGDRLPPQRDLAGRLALDFTTVARGYVEAGKRGLVESVVGRGTFVRRHASVRGDSGPQRSRADFMMNMPPSRTIRSCFSG